MNSNDDDHCSSCATIRGGSGSREENVSVFVTPGRGSGLGGGIFSAFRGRGRRKEG